MCGRVDIRQHKKANDSKRMEVNPVVGSPDPHIMIKASRKTSSLFIHTD